MVASFLLLGVIFVIIGFPRGFVFFLLGAILIFGGIRANQKFEQVNGLSQKPQGIKDVNVLKITGVIFLFFIGLVAYGVYWMFFDMDRLPAGEYLTEETSPDGTYTVKAYVTNGGATTPFAIRGELVFNERGQRTKTIYWDAREETASISWTDPDTVVINGQTLNVPNDRFDYRNQ